MGHFGVDKTLDLLEGKFFWPHMRKDVKRHCHRCISCLKAKSKTMPHGLYTPLLLACAPREDIFSKMTHFIPRHKVDDADNISKLFLREVFGLHGLPKTIVSNKDPKFVSHFWRTLSKRLETKLTFSTSSNPQTDGQTEVVHRSLSTMLRLVMKGNHKSWDEYLPHIEFSYNRVVHKTTNISPFEVVYGFNPHIPSNFLSLPNPHEFMNKEGVTKVEFLRNYMRGLGIKYRNKLRNT